MLGLIVAFGSSRLCCVCIDGIRKKKLCMYVIAIPKVVNRWSRANIPFFKVLFR